MLVALAVLADHANVSREGKLNILGIFDTIFVREFPAVHPQALLIVRFEADISEAETKKPVEIRLIDEDGAQILSVSGEVALGKPEPGEIIQANALLTLNNLTFPHPGRYVFKILVNQEHKADVSLKVIQTKEPSAPSLN